MRERSTWDRSKIAANAKKADDPRAMNQDHLKQQPAADKYDIGGPSEFAEDVHPSAGTWKAEYSGGEVKRNEIGLPEMRSDTFSHPEKTAAQQEEEDETLEKKANLCIRLASRILPKTASERMVEDQSLAFMHMPNAVLIDTYNRLASEEEQDQGQQAKEAGEIPPQFLKDKKDEGDKGQQQDKEAGEIPPQFLKDKKDEGDKGQQQDKQAQQQQAEEEQKKQAQQQQQQAEEEQKKQAQQQAQQDEEKKQASDKLAVLLRQACDSMNQGDVQMAQQQMQQMQQLMGQGQQQQVPPVQQQQPMLADDQLLDQMLQTDVQASRQASSAGAASMDIELLGAEMDIGGTHLASDDEALTALFASSPEAQEAAHAHALLTGIPVQASAGMSRTAATRTVGTRPSGGVASLGGAVPAASGGSDVDKLSGLWQSAPDVKNVFG